MLHRLVVLGLLSFVGNWGRAVEPEQPLAVVPDLSVAQRLNSLCPELAVGVLTFQQGESYAAVNSRALSMRQAQYFIYDGSQESPLVSIFRERLSGQGAIVVDLRQLSMRLMGKPGNGIGASRDDLSLALRAEFSSATLLTHLRAQTYHDKHRLQTQSE
jgi:hypothetical protein